MTTTNQQAIELIQAKGGRATNSRVAILTLLLDENKPVTHQHITELSSNQKKNLDKVTIYRVLDWLIEQQLIHKVSGHDRAWRYAATAEQEHAHFECHDCGDMFCMEKLTPAIMVNMPEGYSLDNAELTLQGRCSLCNRKKV